ncbi:UDP-N-acetylmuramoyl-tripeptide--D-alanyl-D-alanine ligase [Halanaerobaculum tunisiense]
MKPLSILEVTTAVAGELTADVAGKIDSISTDTRTLQAGDVFIALVGSNFDGHDFVAEAFAKGAKLAIVSQEVEVEGPLLVVEDTTQALQDLAAYYRRQFSLPVVAVTGSTGKTTTKDMIAAVLKQKYQTLKTQGNYNNEIGLPLTLLELEPNHEALVVELGMRSLGEIKELASIAEPDYGVVTNVGLAHIELLGSQSKIAQAKGELIASLTSDDVAVLNGDDQFVESMHHLTPGAVINYGLEDNNQLQATEIESLGNSGVEFTVRCNSQAASYPFQLPIPGKYNVYNALAAIAVGQELGLEIEEIKRGLANLELTAMRNQLITTDSGLQIINDAYNANPISMKAALYNLAEITGGRKIAILGDMLELGTLAAKHHQKIGTVVANIELDYLFTIGELAAQIAQGALEAGMTQEQVFSYPTKEEAQTKLNQVVQSQDTILIKASRGMKLEGIIDMLEDKE